MKTVHLSFDIPPSLNRLYRAGRNRIYLSDIGKAYKQSVALLARAQIEGIEPLDGKLGVELRAYGSRLDCDNHAKVLCDALNGIVWRDDKQIQELHIYKLPDDGDKRIEVQIWQL